MKKFLLYFLILIALLAAIIGACWYTFTKLDKSHAGTVHVFQGATTKKIAELLETEGIIEDADYFYYYIKGKIWYEKNISKTFKEENYSFKEGDYKLKDGDFDSVIELLVAGENDPQTITVTFPEGISVVEFATILEQQEIIRKTDFLAYVRNRENYLQFKTKYPWLPAPANGVTEYFEGYLRSTTYLFDKNKPFTTNASVVVDSLLKETNRWYTHYAKDIESSPYSFTQLLTLASIIEKEAKFEKDRPLVSRVFYNRLAKGMKLQSDMTAAYANGEHKVFMYNKDIAVKSPYNTYVVPALPIGPIASPSESSFLAALEPADERNQSLFFYARPSGETFYAVTIQQHQHNINLYEKEWKALEKQEATQKNQP